MRRSWPGAVLVGSYAVLLLFAVLAMPLRLPEILEIAANRHFESLSLTDWIAQTPGSAPLNYFVQIPFLLVLGYTRIGARLDSFLFALAACYIFFRLAKRIPLERPLVALAVFLLVPVHLELASAGRPFEQALFFLLLATEWYLRLMERPALSTAALYTLFLTLCIYTDRYAFLPAIGYLLFLFRFVNRAQERRAMWFALAATVLPVLAFLPYYFWAQPQVNPYWPGDAAPATDAFAGSHALRCLAGNEWIGCALLPLVAAGVIAGAWASFRQAAFTVSKRIALFCLFGGVVSTIAIATITDLWLDETFAPAQIMWATPGMVILLFAGLEWLKKKQPMRMLADPLAAVLILICLAGDFSYISGRSEDTRTEAALVRNELTNDACVVFVSQRFAKVPFLLFAPDLANRECVNFFHERVVLASHAYVTPDQQQDAESFFRGLNFAETKRVQVGGGQIVVMDQAR